MTEMSYQEKRAKEAAEHRAKIFAQIEEAIGPELRYEPVSHNANDFARQRYESHREIITADGERVGSLTVQRTGYSFQHKPDRIHLSSPRIPNTRSRYGEAKRVYRKVESAIAGIKKFCIAVSSDEQRAEVIRKEMSHINRVLSVSYDRSCNPTGERWTSSHLARDLINRLASEDEMDVATAQEQLRILIRKRKVHNRFKAWVDEHLLEPRRQELYSLDLSKETVE